MTYAYIKLFFAIAAVVISLAIFIWRIMDLFKK